MLEILLLSLLGCAGRENDESRVAAPSDDAISIEEAVEIVLQAPATARPENLPHPVIRGPSDIEALDLGLLAIADTLRSGTGPPNPRIWFLGEGLMQLSQHAEGCERLRRRLEEVGSPWYIHTGVFAVRTNCEGGVAGSPTAILHEEQPDGWAWSKRIAQERANGRDRTGTAGRQE